MSLNDQAKIEHETLLQALKDAQLARDQAEHEQKEAERALEEAERARGEAERAKDDAQDEGRL